MFISLINYLIKVMVREFSGYLYFMFLISVVACVRNWIAGFEHEQIGRSSGCRSPCCWYLLWGEVPNNFPLSFYTHPKDHQSHSKRETLCVPFLFLITQNDNNAKTLGFFLNLFNFYFFFKKILRLNFHFPHYSSALWIRGFL